MESIKISTKFIKLDQFLKWCGVADNGVMAKHMVLDGIVKVNGELEERRGRKLYSGDEVEVLGKKFKVK